jgi:hypothetical protein
MSGDDGDGLRRVRIADLVQHRAFQVRKRLHEPTVAKYRRGFQLGGPITKAPILVGRITPPLKASRGRPVERFKTGTLVLLAGYHRVAAATREGHEDILAQIIDTTAREAPWVAAESNMAHGKPLTGPELREAFYVYLRAGKYRDDEGRRKSLREIGRYFGKHHETIRDWMNVPKFRHIYAQYLPEESTKRDRQEAPIEAPSTEEQVMDTVSKVLQNARNMLPILSPDQRAALAVELRETLKAVEADPAVEADHEGPQEVAA